MTNVCITQMLMRPAVSGRRNDDSRSRSSDAFKRRAGRHSLLPHHSFWIPTCSFKTLYKPFPFKQISSEIRKLQGKVRLYFQAQTRPNLQHQNKLIHSIGVIVIMPKFPSKVQTEHLRFLAPDAQTFIKKYLIPQIITIYHNLSLR